MSQKSFLDEIDLSKPVQPPLARSSDPESSHIAAAKNQEHRKSQKVLLIEALQRVGSGTSKELAEACIPPICRYAAGRRCSELKNAGIVEVCGKQDETKE